jgi:hypothetical protein
MEESFIEKEDRILGRPVDNHNTLLKHASNKRRPNQKNNMFKSVSILRELEKLSHKTSQLDGLSRLHHYKLE